MSLMARLGGRGNRKIPFALFDGQNAVDLSLMSPAGKPPAPYITKVADYADSNQWNSNAYNYFFEWTPTRTMELNFLPIVIPTGLDWGYWSLFKGTVPNVDYPAFASQNWNRDKGEIGSDGDGGCIVEAGMAYTVAVVVANNSGQANGIAVDLTPIYQSLQPAGGLDIVPWPELGERIETSDGGVIRPLLPPALELLVAISIHGNGLNGDLPWIMPPVLAYKGPDKTKQNLSQSASFIDVIPPGGYVGPKWQPFNWSEAFTEHHPFFGQVELSVAKVDGSQIVTVDQNQAADASIHADSSNNYNFSFMNWAAPSYKVGSDLTTTGDGKVHSTAGGVFIVSLMASAYFN